ncbi:MAG: MotA/TolQ/ExbB proton channel family protein [Ignavibacteriales bacterium]|nr:MotA/TolQ/ExbB proton channel family protein [Ignavibacteriales bacterium]
MRKAGSINGLILGIFAIFGSFIFEGGSLRALFLGPAMLIVFGGTFAAVIIGFGMDKFLMIFVLIKKAYLPEKYNTRVLVDDFVDLSIKVRQFGLLSIEKEIDRFEHYFTRKMLRYMLDGSDAESIEIMARAEMKFMQERHLGNIFIFTKMGGYAPTMGILGTVMGLIMTLANAGNDPTQLIHSIASAFIATLWGVFSANIFWLPIGDKLKQCHIEEKHLMEVSLEGVLALHSGEIPCSVR